MDAIFHALAHQVRRRILDIVKSQPGLSVNAICCHFEISRIAVSKHIKILEAADLLVIEKKGKENCHYFNVIPIQMIYERWTDEYSQFWASRLVKFKQELEEKEDERQQKLS